MRECPELLPCVMPWKALFMDERDGEIHLLPCCANWISKNYGRLGSDETLEDFWNGEGARQIRAMLISGRQEELCSPDCPWLNSGRFGEDCLRVLDGPEEFVNNQRLNHAEIGQRRTRLRSRPIAVRIIPTLRCNIRCRMCHQDHGGSLRLPERFLAEIRSLAPCLYDYQLHGGEVLLSREFLDWADPEMFSRHPQMKLSLVTNGTCLPPWARAALEQIRINYITVSLNAASRATYRDITGADLFDQTLANVVYLKDLGRRHPKGPFRTYLSFVIMRSNFRELPDFVRLASRLELPIHLLLVTGNRGGESIYTEPWILTQVAGEVDKATALAAEESRQEVEMIGRAVRRLLEQERAN